MRDSIRLSDTTQDCLFLRLVVLLSLILYIGSLGFYSDDWFLVGRCSTSTNQSLLGLFRSIYLPNVLYWMRPVQILYLVVLYWFFGLHPLGYHLMNAAVLVWSTLLFYLVLREFEQERILALVAPAVYVLLLHYSTDRFWIAAMQANLSMALYFLSLYADLRALHTRSGSFWRWKALSLLSLLGSTLAYEVVLPFFLLNLFLVWARSRQLYGSATDKYLRPANAIWVHLSN